MFSILKKKLGNLISKTEKKVKEKQVKKIKKPGLKEKIIKKITETKISEKDLDEILKDFETDLWDADVAFEVSEKIKQDLKKDLVGKSVGRTKVKDTIIKSFKKSLSDILEIPKINIKKIIKENKPCLIVFLGFNGSGKTTTLAKFSQYLKKKGFSSVFAAADTFRAASIEQLEEHGKKLGIKVIKHKYGADAAAVIYDAKEHAKARNIDVILADTAGRSHANANLMDELKKICKVNKPDLKILVLDSMTGNDIVEQCKTFDNAVGVDAIILSKLDVSNKGGSVLSAAYILKKPILFLGNGQNYKDLLEYDKDIVIKKIL